MSNKKARSRMSVSCNPIAVAVRHASRGVPVLAASVLLGGTAMAQTGTIEEILVTAQKRTENLQDVPISVQVLSQSKLEELDIKRFDDYVLYMPSVSFSSAGPSQAQIYMRGVSDGGDGNFSGTNPSVAVYLDEQPVTSIGRNLDVHIYDIARIEALAGPQGTLYGASSQAGTIRIITNPPDPSAFAAGYDLSAGATDGGDESYSGEGFVNIPMGDRAAIRLVGWSVTEGGWIDNAAGSMSFPNDPNTPININGNPNFIHSDLTVQNTGNANSVLNTVEDDVNELTTTGARAALKLDLNDSWTGTASVMYQNQESDGVFADQPDSGQVGQGEAVRFGNDQHEDEWTQLGLTIEGDLGFADLTFAGSYLDREVSYDIDYTSYSAYSGYVELYYSCDTYSYYNNGGYVSYLLASDIAGCQQPRIQYEQDSDYKRSTFELRLQSKGEGRLHWVAGLFYEEDEHDYFNQWYIPSMNPGNAIPTDRNIQGAQQLYFATNQERDIEHQAVFGEISYDFTDQLSGTLGARYFKTDDELEGFTGSRFSCYDPATGNRIGGPTSTGACGAGLDTDEDDNTWKVNVTYQFTDDIMVYATYSEGYRPGGINRIDTPEVPQIYSLDEVKNYELGWKTTLADGTVRLNGAVYYMDWSDMQLTRFDPSVSLLGLTANTDGAEITGIEVDGDWLVNENWRISAAASWNEAELSDDFSRSAEPGATPDASDGTDLPFTPDFKATVSTRFTFQMMGMDSYVRGVYSYTDESYNDLFTAARAKQDSYGILNAAIGIEGETWTAELYGNNLTDENAELFRYTRAGDRRVTTNRPINFGVRFSHRFK